MRKAMLLMVMLFGVVSAVFAQPKIAVYMTGGNTPDEEKMLVTAMTAALDKNRMFTHVEIGDDFQDVVAKEIRRQKGGSVDRVNQIVCKAGKQNNAEYVCIGDITYAFKSTMISTRILDVETVGTIAIGKVTIKAPNLNDFDGDDIIEYLEDAMKQMTPKVLKLLSEKGQLR